MREIALRMLNERPLDLVEVVKRWDDGFVAALALLTADESPFSDLDGLRLIVRTEGKHPDACAWAYVSAEQIRDDESGMVLDGLLTHLRRDCERALAAAI